MIKGEFGIVYRGLYTPNGDIINSAPMPVAIKTLKGNIIIISDDNVC